MTRPPSRSPTPRGGSPPATPSCLLTPAPFTLTTFPNHDGYDQLVLARAIPFTSLCQHHLLPFTGLAHIGYLRPSGSWACPSWPGWSSCTPAASRSKNSSPPRSPTGSRPTWNPRGVGVVLEAEHQCMSLRGVRAAEAYTVTSASTACSGHRPALPPGIPGPHRHRHLTTDEELPMPTKRTFAIVGGLAGAKAAETLRAEGLRRPSAAARRGARAVL